ncbi:hypothetical protein GWR56_13465 [Mucilaginibacter sp. 14171R-50]|uniref:hypothetical protein n=1 Tax=Mucilaginibacter sp. 14171R-50 TaxID=2703789 RepID=UPI00138C1B54|nr:hypothetical protein [Mucilaginibacter sp. 14171R-50]QHS56496.1 hypothetical protein GWR56_13465 [Mucilaginibacter sp. 14171R-50]
MMKRPAFIALFLLFFTSLLAVSCKEFIEPSIENKKVYLKAPSDGFQSKLYKISFWWDEVEDALGYRLQVVSPGFAAPDRLVLDTLVSGNKFSVNLDPGKYEWHLRAENGSTVTAYSGARSFEVLQSSIKQQAVELNAPADQAQINNAQVNLRWGTLYGAARYRLQIDTNNFINESSVVYNEALPGNELALALPKDQSYQWRVQAENDTAQSRWSVVNHFTLDRLPPGRVKALEPADNQTVNKPVHLRWENVASAVRYRLYLLKSDSVTSYSKNFPVIVNENTYDFQSGTGGERIYWKVAAIDAAGNAGTASATRSFIIP